MSKGQKAKDKGANAEEAARSYFRTLDYFVVRGVKMKRPDEITDIDLVLYKRISPFARHLVNVDIKDKRKRAKAAERLIVAAGIRDALGFDSAIIVTSDTSEGIARTGAEIGVGVIGGAMLTRLKAETANRLTDEELETMLGFDAKHASWKSRFEDARAEFANGLGFQSIARWLADARSLLEESRTNPQRAEVAVRLAALNLAFAFVAMDYVMTELAFEGKDKRRRHLQEHLALGEGGRARLGVASGYAGIVAAVLGVETKTVEHGIREIAEKSMKAHEGISEFFAEKTKTEDLVHMAIQLESYAYQREFVPLNQASAPIRSAVGAILDHFGMSRRDYLTEAD